MLILVIVHTCSYSSLPVLINLNNRENESVRFFYDSHIFQFQDSILLAHIQVIHPSQVPIVQEAFSPSAEKLEWARELVKAFNEQSEQGRGAIEFRGQMVDMPLVLQARNILKYAD